MAKYLKDILAEQGSPIDFEFVGRSELIEKRKKDGGTYEVYEYTFLANGKPHTENIWPKTHDYVLQKAVKGDICRAALEGQYVNWSILPRGEEVLAMPNPTTTQSIRRERAVVKEDIAGVAHDWKLGIAGVYQARLAAGMETTEARKKAIEDAKWIREAAGYLAVDPNYQYQPSVDPDNLPF